MATQWDRLPVQDRLLEGSGGVTETFGGTAFEVSAWP